MKINKKNVITAIAVVIVVFIFVSFFQYCARDFIVDAAVNPETGDITILNLDYELKTYDQYGNLMYEFKILDTNGGYAHLRYENQVLLVYVLRTYEVRKYDQTGNLIEELPGGKPIPYAWDTWQRDSKSYFYETDTYCYSYTKPSFWRYLFVKDDVVVKITDKETNIKTILEKA